MVWGIREVLSWIWNNEDFSLASQEEEAETDWKHLIAPFVLTVICVAWARKRFGAHRLYIDPQHHDIHADSGSKGCSNEHCVRCQNYRLPTATLLHRLELYALELKASDPSDHRNGNTSAFIVDNDSTCRNCLDGVRNAVTALQLEPLTQTIDADNTHNQRDGTQNPTVFFMPLPASAFPTLHRSLQVALDQSFTRVVDEYTSLMTRTASPPSLPSIIHPTMPWGENDTVDDGRWRTLYLYNQGHKNVSVCAHLPHTTALLESFPSLLRDCAFGNAFFSVIYPGTIISPHTGPTNIRHRVMFPIQIPKHGRATLHVDNKTTQLSVGNSVVFDDSYWHWAEFHVMDDDNDGDNDGKANTNTGQVSIQSNSNTPPNKQINVTNKRLSVDDPHRETNNGNDNDNDDSNTNDNANNDKYNDDDDDNVSECDSCDSDTTTTGSEPRVTFIFDLWHPSLTHEERCAIARMWP